MAARKQKVSYKQISKLLHQKIRRFKRIRPHASRAERSKIDLNIRTLKTCDRELSARCRGMDILISRD
jgi:hypothetical protein